MTRRPIFWLLFSACGLGGALTAVLLFSTALPSISVDIEMDRAAAIDSAAALATRFGWGASDDRSAATFGVADDLVQTFVELEAGGRDEFQRLSERNVYEPYQWSVRRFAEGRVEESSVRFTPQGEPYGFRLRLAETDPGNGNLTEGEARLVAEATAADWGVDLDAYRLTESSQETLPGGRLDHSFVYQRVDEQLGEGRFRLRMDVAGSRVSELTQFVRIPEAFSRRYAEMRSTNETIALVAQAVLLLVFVLLGAGVGSALLLRERWLEWRAPLAWGAAIALFFGASTVNRLPLTWTVYDTALSSTNFVLQQLAGGVAIALLGTPLIAFFLLAGESLGRRAFPRHVQQWRFWSPEVASSSSALGMTVAAYLLVGIQVGYVVLFYLGTQRLEGWWSPADALVQPDLLATYMPWLEAVSLAFFASFWEESVFRAVPIACAALLGARFGRRGLWIWGAVVVQAVVFAAGHANYPQQPPYARVIELTAPALLWGIVYVRFGLVPTITAHFLYDLSLISVVLFETRALFDQGVIVVVGLIPLAVVLAARVRRGARSDVPEWALNGAWLPRSVPGSGAPETGVREGPSWTMPGAGDGVSERPTGPGEAALPPLREEASSAAPRTAIPGWAFRAAGVMGLAAVVLALVLRASPPALWGDREEAVAAALAELERRGVRPDEWGVSVATSDGATEGRNYVFQEAGREAFAELEGVYFGQPRWVVRLVDWQAEPDERVEEYRVWVGREGRVSRVSHTVPEARAGASLDVAEARAIALASASESFDLSASALAEVEAVQTSRPARTDWLFTFRETGRLSGVEGEARVQVRVTGDEVADVAPTIYVPEDWQRTRRRVESRTQIMSGGLALLLVLGFIAAAVTGVVVWSRGGLPARVFWRLSLVSFVGLLASAVNDWPVSVAAFTTSQPWGVQAGTTAIALLLLAFMAAPAIGLVGALAHAWLAGTSEGPTPRGSAPALGLLLGGATLLVPLFVPDPGTASYAGAAALVPALALALGQLSAYLLLTAAALAVVALRVRFAHKPFVISTLASFALAAAVVVVPLELQASLLTWGAGALVVLAVLGLGLKVCSESPALVPGIVAGMLAVSSLWVSWSGPYAGSTPGGMIAAVMLVALGWAWTRELVQSRTGTRFSVGSE